MKRKRECLQVCTRIWPKDMLQHLRCFLALPTRLHLATALSLPKAHAYWKYSPIDAVLSWLNARFLVCHDVDSLYIGVHIEEYLDDSEIENLLRATSCSSVWAFVLSKLPSTPIAAWFHYLGIYCEIDFKSPNFIYRLKITDMNQDKATCILKDVSRSPKYCVTVSWNAYDLVQAVKNRVRSREHE